MRQIYPDAASAYDSIYANMNAIKTVDKALLKNPLLIYMIKTWPKILEYLNKEDEELKAELTELTKGGKNIKKRYAKNTKGRRRQISRKR
jgi:hypothetical protein